MTAKVWRYTIMEEGGTVDTYTMIGPAINREKAMSALTLHFPPERILSLKPVNPKSGG